MKPALLFSSFLSLSFYFHVAQAMPPIDLGVRVNSGRQQFVDEGVFEKYLEVEAYGQYHLFNMFAVNLGAFARLTDERNYGGAQLSTPLILDIKRLGVSTYMAPGYRFMNRGLSAPTLGSGVTLKMLGEFGIGYRLILNEWVKNGLKTEGQVFLSVGF